MKIILTISIIILLFSYILRRKIFTRSFWVALQSYLAGWPTYGISSITLITGVFVTYDWEDAAINYPGWSSLITFTSNNIVWIFILVAIVNLAFSIISSYHSRTVKELEGEVIQYRNRLSEVGNVIEMLCDGLLLNLSDKLNLPEGANARISLYVHDQTNEQFIPCGRYSRNPIFSKKGRPAYPEKQGCINEGWQKTWHFDNMIPAASAAAGRRDYLLKNYNIPHDVSERMNMKSTTYAVKRLDNPSGKAVALIVLEALDKDSFTEARAKDILDSVANDYARLISELRGYVPNPNIAKASGL